MSWYLRSMANYDTHYGELGQDGIVMAECGAQFWPRLLTFDRRALPRYPPDPDQVCPECQHTRVKIPGQGSSDRALTRVGPTAHAQVWTTEQ